MSFDNYEPTTIIRPTELDRTDELPVVVTRRPRRQGGVGVAIAVGALAALAIIAGFLFFGADREQPDSTLTTATDSTSTEAVLDGAAQETTEVTDQPAGEPGFWTVVGVPDRLNVRSQPGTQSEVVGSLGNGDRHIFGTGQIADVGGSTWVQVVFDADDDQVGWVSGRFLAADTEPGDAPVVVESAAPTSAGSQVCFSTPDAPGRVAQLTISDNKEISGLLVVPDTPVFRVEELSGTLDDGRADVTLTDRSSDATRSQVWIFEPTAINPGNEAPLLVVDCASIAARLP